MRYFFICFIAFAVAACNAADLGKQTGQGESVVPPPTVPPSPSVAAPAPAYVPAPPPPVPSPIAYAGAPPPPGVPQPVVAPSYGAVTGRIYKPTFPNQIIDREQFPDFENNPVIRVADQPVSTFSVDVDTASYAVMRRELNGGRLPPADAIRIEEFINYFPYDYPAQTDPRTPCSTNVTLLPTPWNNQTQLMHIGLKGYEPPQTERPDANIVLLIDTSGSMSAPDKLPLLRRSFLLFLDSLEPQDRVSIVTYAGSTGVVLEPTPVSERVKIEAALRSLNPFGGTAGGAGINLAYDQAEAGFIEGGINRIFLATDGDFNIGPSSPDALGDLISTKRETGVFLSVLSFGRGNLNDRITQTLAQKGNGTAAYIDTLSEARKVLVDDASRALIPIASDVKVQVEFNPARVAEYRLIGYETRALNREDFNNDAVDAGDINSGHTVTALYEVTPVGSDAVLIDALRYEQPVVAPLPTSLSEETAFVKLRYKRPGESFSTLINRPVMETNAVGSVDVASQDVRFAVAVAGFGQVLRGSIYLKDYDFDSVEGLAKGAIGDDPFGYRTEFVSLVRLARDLDRTQ